MNIIKISDMELLKNRVKEPIIKRHEKRFITNYLESNKKTSFGKDRTFGYNYIDSCSTYFIYSYKDKKESILESELFYSLVKEGLTQLIFTKKILLISQNKRIIYFEKISKLEDENELKRYIEHILKLKIDDSIYIDNTTYNKLLDNYSQKKERVIYKNTLLFFSYTLLIISSIYLYKNKQPESSKKIEKEVFYKESFFNKFSLLIDDLNREKIVVKDFEINKKSAYLTLSQKNDKKLFSFLSKKDYAQILSFMLDKESKKYEMVVKFGI